MNVQTMTAGILIALIVSGPVGALTIVNEDDVTQTVTVTMGNTSRNVAIVCGGEVEVDCRDSCILRLADDDEGEFYDDETVFITEGLFSIAE